MIPIQYKVIVFLFLNTILLNAQETMNFTIEELNTKNKSELVEIALQIIKEKYPEIIVKPSEFDSRVWKNEYNIVTVVFRRVIRYVSKETTFTNYDITVNLISKEITPLDTDKASLYQPSKKEENSIAELKKKGFLSNEILPEIEYTITENDVYYLISCFNDFHHIDKKLITNTEHPYLSKSLINKKTGEILYFKGVNPFYYLSQKTAKHYYQENSYLVLNEEYITNKSNKIVEMAYSILKSKQPHLKLNPNDFEIILLGNYKDLVVKFKRHIRYINKKNDSSIKYDLVVNIITKEIFPFESSEVVFYTSSNADLDAIKFVSDKMSLSLEPGIEHTLVENNNYYWISSFSKKEVKKYFIEKQTNKISCFSESENLRVNNYEDLSFYEEYARGNQFFPVAEDKKEELIKMALVILKEKQFSPEINLKEYTITIKSSKKEVLVTFDKLLKFTPLRLKKDVPFYHDLEVNLVSKKVNQDISKFYFPTEEEKAKIQFVKDKLANYFSQSAQKVYPIEIIEELDYYIIKTYNFTLYHLDKRTGKIDKKITEDTLYPTPMSPPLTDTEIK